VKVYGISTVEDIERFADLHNDYVVSLTRDPAKLQRLGLTQDRALGSMFTADTKPRLIQNWSERAGAIDQSNLARFLVAVMSSETCRKVLIDFEAAGFIQRQRSPYGTVVVWSTGRIEEIFAEMLRDLRNGLQELKIL
jgi:DNA-binding MarR family transcriptional regulator